MLQERAEEAAVEIVSIAGAANRDASGPAGDLAVADRLQPRRRREQRTGPAEAGEKIATVASQLNNHPGCALSAASKPTATSTRVIVSVFRTKRLPSIQKVGQHALRLRPAQLRITKRMLRNAPRIAADVSTDRDGRQLQNYWPGSAARHKRHALIRTRRIGGGEAAHSATTPGHPKSRPRPAILSAVAVLPA